MERVSPGAKAGSRVGQSLRGHPGFSPTTRAAALLL